MLHRKSTPRGGNFVRPTTARTALAIAGAAGLTIAITTAVGPAAATPSTTVVISEVYGGGGNSGAPLTNDFIELQNVGSTAIDLTGYSVQYHSSSSTAGNWQATPLSGSIPAHGRWLVQEAAGSTASGPLPPPDGTGTINLSATAGTVALVHDTGTLSCGVDCPANSSVVDLVGFGTAAIHEGATDAPAGSNTTSIQRAANGTDTDENGVDFTVGSPTPTNSGAGGGGTPEPGPLRIHDIQGTSWVSPRAGDAVTNVPGIVTGVRTGSSRGFWMQDPNPDSDPATSEGIFIFTGSAPAVHTGDSVLVSGKVSDFYPLSSGETTSSTSNLSTTEIGSSPSVITVSSGNALPDPIVLGPGNVPSAYAPDLGGANIEGTPITPNRSVLDFYESIEGMRAEADDARVVGPSNTFGEQFVTVKPDEGATYRGGTELLGENQVPSGRLEIVTPDGSDLGLNVGDVLQGATVGPIDWSNFGGYELVAQTLGDIEQNGLAPVTATPGTAQQLSIATYNVENLSPSDPDAKFRTLGAGIVTELASPDIVALEEIQDNSGAADDGTVAADQTLGKLIGAIGAAGGPHYSYREIDPVNDQDGGQPGGNIRVAFLFNPNRVTFVDAGSAGVNRSTTGTQVVRHLLVPGLTLSPGRIDPTNPVWTASRKPLVGQFRFHGKPVFVIANHWDSKLGDQNADGRFQYPAQSSQVQRAGQAQVVHDFVQRLLDVSPLADVVVLGDLNDYQFSAPLLALRTGTADGSGKPILTDLITTLPVNQQYTYVFDGVSEVLDHILVSPAVKRFTYQVVHVNAEYSTQVSDHDPQVVDLTP
jgi:predicted extracellular nuclease